MNNLDGILDCILYTLEVSLLPDKIHYQQFDGVGRVVKVLVDADAKTGTGKAQPDGSGGTARGIDQVVEYTLNVKGEVTEMKRDNNVDGTYDVREVSVLDANGNVVETQYDKTNDGKIDSVTKNTLNAKGEVIEAKYYNQAENGAQTLIGRDAFERDANGYITKNVSYSASGDISVAETYTNDAQGRVLQKLIDNYGDGNIERAEIYTLDANGYIAKPKMILVMMVQLKVVSPMSVMR